MKLFPALRTFILLFSLALITLTCGSESDSTSQQNVSNTVDDKKEDDCTKKSADDFDNFLGIDYGTNELRLEKILGPFTGGEYTEDSVAFMYYFKKFDNVPVTVWVNSKSQKVETIFMEVLSYEEYFKSDLNEAAEYFKMKPCDSDFFGKSVAQIKEILGTPAREEILPEGQTSLTFDSKDLNHSVNFKFYPEQNNICSSISINWFYN